MQLPGYPTDVDTVESLLVWAATALDNKKYPAVTLNDSIAGASPISIRTGRVTASAQFNEPYVRITADLPLNTDSVNVQPLYEAVEELVAGDDIPTALSDSLGVGVGGAPNTAESLYTLPFAERDYHFWFRGENMLQSGFNNIVFNDVLGHINGTVTGDENYVAVFNGQPGFCFAGNSSGDVAIPEIIVTEFTLILCAAFISNSLYISTFKHVNPPYNGISIGPNSELYAHSQYAYHRVDLTVNDENLHVYMLTFGNVSAELYLDGVLVDQIAASVPGTAISPMTVQELLHDQDYLYFLSDFVLLNRKITAQEIADSYAAIATHRGLL